MKVLCSVDDCNRESCCKGFCDLHYRRFLKYGDPFIKKHATKKVIPLEKRFEKNTIPVPESGCIIWLKSWNREGYGIIGIEHKSCLAHRIAWEIYRGEIPEGMDVLHKCDTPPCVNPNHLFLGTQIDNIKDMVKKGRARALQGEENPLSKLKKEDILFIRQKVFIGKIRGPDGKFRKSYNCHKQIADIYNITSANVRSIINRKTWKHI
jgi:hypothetical protein